MTWCKHHSGVIFIRVERKVIQGVNIIVPDREPVYALCSIEGVQEYYNLHPHYFQRCERAQQVLLDSLFSREEQGSQNLLEQMMFIDENTVL